MRVTSLLISLFFISTLGYSQDEKSESDTTRVSLGGGKEIIIINKNDEVDVSVTNESDSLNTDADDGKVDMNDFTYWSGIDLGVNTLMMTDEVRDANEWLDIDEKRSLSFSLNIIEKKIPIVKHYLGLNTGLGFTWQSFEFNDTLNIINLDGDSLVAMSASPREYDKNRLKAGYVKVPLMLEINTSKYAEKNFHIAAGIIGGWNYRSVFKQKYEEDGDKVKEKTKGDYNINPFSLEATARIGYGDFTVFANASMTSLFEEDKGPEAYPVTIGITMMAF